jgi:polyhydroxyalkanoate synthesis regulator phasin
VVCTLISIIEGQASKHRGIKKHRTTKKKKGSQPRTAKPKKKCLIHPSKRKRPIPTAERNKIMTEMMSLTDEQRAAVEALGNQYLNGGQVCEEDIQKLINRFPATEECHLPTKKDMEEQALKLQKIEKEFAELKAKETSDKVKKTTKDALGMGAWLLNHFLGDRNPWLSCALNFGPELINTWWKK